MPRSRYIVTVTYQCSQASQNKRNEKTYEASQEPYMWSARRKTHQEETDGNLNQHNSDTDGCHVNKTPFE